MASATRPSGAVTVLASLNLDISVTAPRLPGAGETVLGDGVTHCLGGKGGNQAVALARLGAKVALIGCVGDDDAGHRYLAALAGEGIDVEHVEVAPSLPTGTALISVSDTGENTIVVVPGAGQRAGLVRPGAIGPAVEGAGVVLCGLEVPLEGAAALLTAGRRAGVITVLNPAPAVPGAGALVGLADILVPNETELVGLLDDLRLPHPPGSPATWVEPELAAAGRALTSFGATWVVVTLGAAGAALIGRAGRVWRCPAQAVRAVDTTAAGDAFVAGLTCIIASAGNLDRDTMRRACQQGAVVAAFSVQRRGAQPSLPTLADIGLLDE